VALFKNSLLGLLPSIASVAVSIATVPLYVRLVGEERYGALLVALVLLGYFGQADFGLGRAVTQRLSSQRSALPHEHASIVWTAIAGASVISLVGGVVVYAAAGLFFQTSFEADASLRAEIAMSAWLFALCVPVIMFTGISSGALTGMERFGVVSAGTTIGNLLSQVLPLVVAATHSVEFGWLLAASLAGRMIGLVPIIWSMFAVFLRNQPINPKRQEMAGLFSYGRWIMVTAIVGPLMVSADRVVIGAVLGAAAVVAYAVPVQIAQRTVMFPTAIVQALFPRMASQDVQNASALGLSAVVLIGQLYAFVIIGLMCLGGPLLELWMGTALDPRSLLVGQITLVGFWLNALANVPYALIQARGNSRFTALLHVLELPIYLAMLFGFGASYGLYGVALAFTLRNFIDCIALFRKGQFFVPGVMSGLVGPALLIMGAFASSYWAIGWLWSMGAAGLLCSILLPLTFRQMPDDMKSRLLERVRG
jgi:O-antigen/teichoic acid export membrane protein